MPCTFNGTSGKAVGLIGFLLLAGCQHFAQGNRTADYPIGTQFPQIYQQQLQASAHWQLIAHNEAHLLVTRFDEAPSLRLNPRGSDGETAFDRAYHDFLAEGLLNEGALLFDAGEDARVEYDIEVIDFAARSQLNLPPGFISTTVLSAYIIGHAIEAWSNPAALLIPAAIGADFYQYMNADSPTPDTEIILTTRVKQDARLVYSHSSIYYLRTADAGLYQGGGAIKVRGPVVL